MRGFHPGHDAVADVIVRREEAYPEVLDPPRERPRRRRVKYLNLRSKDPRSTSAVTEVAATAPQRSAAPPG